MYGTVLAKFSQRYDKSGNISRSYNFKLGIYDKLQADQVDFFNSQYFGNAMCNTFDALK